MDNSNTPESETAQPKKDKKSFFSWSKNLNLRVIIVMAIIIIAAFTILGLIVDNTVSTTVENLAQERNLESSRALQNEVSSLLLNLVTEIESAAAEESDRIDDDFSFRHMFAGEILDEHEEITSLVFALPDGEYLSQPEAEEEFIFSPEEDQWFTEPEETGEIYWSGRHISEFTDEEVIRFSFSVEDEGEFVGVLLGEIPLNNLQNLVLDREIGQEGLSFIVDREGVVLAHPEEEIFQQEFNIVENFDLAEILAGEEGNVEYEDQEEVLQVASYVPLPELEGAVVVQEPARDVYLAAGEVRSQIIYVGFAAVILAIIGLYLFFNFQIIKPLHALSSDIEKVSKGDLQKEITVNREDVIGQLSKSFNFMTAELQNIISKIKSSSQKVNQSAENMHEASSQVGEVSQQVSSSIEQVAAGADDQAVNVDKVNDKMQNLNKSMQDLTDSNQVVENLADGMQEVSVSGQQEMEKVHKQMELIRNSIEEVAQQIEKLENISTEIDDILDIINNIAQQTNLLALNAAIEAARAGEAGRGFSVVADEIRELAEESGNSAEKIGELILDIQQETDSAGNKMEKSLKQVKSGEDVVSSAGDTFDEINNSVNKVNQGIAKANKMVENVKNSSSEIVTSIENIASISEETSASAEEVAAASEEQTASVEEIVSSSETLKEMAAELEKLVKRFNL